MHRVSSTPCGGQGQIMVDFFGIDIYLKSHQAFSDVYEDFHENFAEALNKTCVIGEHTTSSDAEKMPEQSWAQKLG